MGYTKCILDALQTPVHYYTGGVAHTLGGPSDYNGIRVRCLGRIRAWIHLIKDILRSEFQPFDATASFDCLFITGTSVAHTYFEQAEQKLHSIPTFLDVDEDVLRDEHRLLAPSAILNAAATPELPVYEVWDKARKQLRGPKTPLMELVLRNLAAMCPPNCGVEQNLSQHQWAPEGRRAWNRSQFEFDELRLLCDVDLADANAVEALVLEAHKVWVDCLYGTPRASGPEVRQPRRDVGSKRPQPASASTEIAFVKRRRSAVSDALSTDAVAAEQAAGARALPSFDPARWSARHKAERAFNTGKQFDRLVDNVLVGAVHPE